MKDYSMHRTIFSTLLILIFSINFAFANETKSNISNSTLIDRKQADNTFWKALESDKELSSDPEKRTMVMCTMELALDEAFNGLAVLDSAVLESRLKTAMENVKNGMEKEDPNVIGPIKKCYAENIDFIKDVVKLDKKLTKYKAILSKSSTPLNDMDELRVDIASMNGKKVRVKGIGYYVMNLFMIKKDSTDTSPIVVDIAKLQRDQKLKIIKQCADIMRGCNVGLYGVVGKVGYESGIIASRIEW
jgi:hypothetical protein